MKLSELLDIVSEGATYTVGAENGENWILYCDEEGVITMTPPYRYEDFLNRDVVEVSTRRATAEWGEFRALNGGLGIIVTGNEDGAI